MTPESDALFALVTPPAGATVRGETDAAYDASAAATATLSTILQRMTAIRAAAMEADRREDDPLVHGHFEHLRQVTGAVQREANAAITTLAKVCDALFQLDRAGAESMQAITNPREAAQPLRLSVSKAEMDHLQQRAEAGDAAVAELAKTTMALKAADPAPVPDVPG